MIMTSGYMCRWLELRRTYTEELEVMSLVVSIMIVN